jgi:hypothetical protein
MDLSEDNLKMKKVLNDKYLIIMLIWINLPRCLLPRTLIYLDSIAAKIYI